MAKFRCKKNNVFGAKNYCEFLFIFSTDMNVYLDFTAGLTPPVHHNRYLQKNLGYTLQNIRKTLKV